MKARIGLTTFPAKTRLKMGFRPEPVRLTTLHESNEAESRRTPTPDKLKEAIKLL